MLKRWPTALSNVDQCQYLRNCTLTPLQPNINPYLLLVDFGSVRGGVGAQLFSD